MSCSTESEVGIEFFLTETEGIKGKLRVHPEDFVVVELSKKPEKVPAGRYTVAIVKARNWETNRLVRHFARRLGISRRRIYFAGTKDKRSVSVQMFLFLCQKDKVENLKIKDVNIMDVYETDRRIGLGDLKGNLFEVFIRNVELPVEIIRERLERIGREIEEKGGFPNFFGIQRFGALRPVTHVVGKHILRGEFKEAVHAYLGSPMEGEPKEAYEARALFERTGSFLEALRAFPKELSFESALLNYLAKNEDDYVGALGELPLNLQMMFIHAYQSYLFNRMLSERARRGLPLDEPLLGDIVLPSDVDGLPDRNRLIEVNEKNIEKVRRKAKEGKAYVSGAVFGSSSLLARGEMGEIERGILEEERVRPEDFIITKMPRLSSKGKRRELLARVWDLSYELISGAVKMKFKLAPGCYATSLLREFMKGKAVDY